MSTLLVLSVVMLLVAGALAFTSSERSAAALQTRADRLSGCAQAAKNLFLAQVRVYEANIGGVTLSSSIQHPDGEMQLESGHYTGSQVSLTGIKRLPDATVGGSSNVVYDLSNRVGRPGLLAGYYAISALCREKAGGAEQEIEFVMRVGL